MSTESALTIVVCLPIVFIKAFDFDIVRDTDREDREGGEWAFWRRSGSGWLRIKNGEKLCFDNHRLINDCLEIYIRC